MCFVGTAQMVAAAPTQMEYLRSTKGGVQLVLNEFMYYRGETRGGGRVTWRCIDYQRLRCKALCYTVDGRVTRISGSHEHGLHTDTIRKRRERQDLLSTLRTVSDPLAGAMPAPMPAPMSGPPPGRQGLEEHPRGQAWHV